MSLFFFSFYDILVYSCNEELHAKHLSQVSDLLMPYSLYVKLFKCKFSEAAIIYLGHLIFKDGVETNNEKIIVVLE